MTDSTDDKDNRTNNLVKLLLANVKTNLKEDRLYYWGWDETGSKYLDPRELFRGKINKYHMARFDFSHFADYRKENLSAELYERTGKIVFIPFNEYFILSVHSDNILYEGNKNIVVTNVMPEKTIVKSRRIRSDEGYYEF